MPIITGMTSNQIDEPTTTFSRIRIGKWTYIRLCGWKNHGDDRCWIRYGNDTDTHAPKTWGELCDQADYQGSKITPLEQINEGQNSHS